MIDHPCITPCGLAQAAAMLLCGIALTQGVRAEDVQVAAAANFRVPLQALAARFEAGSGHHVVASFASTAKLYAQIKAGAPFDVLLAADQKTAARLEEEGDIVAGSRFTYASGRLALWSARAGVVDAQGGVLRTASFDKLAIANPRLAPYGAAAMEVLQEMGLVQTLQPRIVQGEDIGQTYQFVATGNATLGFIALSQVMRDGAVTSGSAWIVPATLHAPLRQDAVLLKTAAHPAGARAWLAFLHSDGARALLRNFGYDA